MGAHVIARGVAVFDHPLCRRQDQGTLAETAQSDPIEFPFDRINSRCHPTMFRVLGCRGLLECDVGWLQVARYARRTAIVVENSRDFVVTCPRYPRVCSQRSIPS